MENSKQHTIDTHVPGRFDPITAMLEDFFRTHGKEIQELGEAVAKDVFQPAINANVLHCKGDKATKALSECVDVALNRLRSLAKRLSIEVWYIYIRRMPLLYIGRRETLGAMSLSVLKWANWEQSNILANINSNKEYGAAFSCNDDDILSCFELFFLNKSLNHALSVSRWISKGADLGFDEKGCPQYEADREIEHAVMAYERRRPKQLLFSDIAIPVEIKDSKILADSIMLLTPLKQPLPIICPKNNQTIFLMNYSPTFFPADYIHKILRSYENAIVDIYGASPDAILQTLHSLARRIVETIPYEYLDIHDDHIVLQEDLTNDDVSHRIRFMFSLCQKGYLRFPEAVFREKLSVYGYRPTTGSPEEASKLVNQFFDNFSLNEDRRKKIDILSNTLSPLVFTGPSSLSYIDMTMQIPFFENILMSAKEWFTTQHGDMFTLFVKQFVEQQVPDAKIINAKTTFKSKDGKRSEVDLLIMKGENILAVECKAYAKPKDFLIGRRSAVNLRTSKVNAWAKQAKTAAETISQCIRDGLLGPLSAHNVQWAVCTPSQEFICPLDRYGMLTDGIPRVCTPEELVKFLSA